MIQRYTKRKTFTNKNVFIYSIKYGLLGILLFLGQLIKAQQQMVQVTGKVNTSDEEPLAYASILLEDTRYGTMSDKEGKFSFDAPAGQYTLIITYAGFTARSIPIVLNGGEVKDMGVIVIEAASNQLREVIVEDIQTNKFANKQTATPARMPLANLENPQAYSVIRKELMQEQVAIDYNSALVSVPGAVVSNGVNDSGNDIRLRGFSSQAT
ncbi:hypothetical protein GCM10023231_39410 [Olivibacter ginsenosidimutans]|uniref:TonB-dependent receptor plug domain-containing protein n=1 Tax=Olivibacter ginsenosidimutans TaxID=1176537 RepID=A0ABP9C8S3_9SPHI